MDKEKIKQKTKEIKEKADEIEKEVDDVPQKKGTAKGDPCVTLNE